MGFFDALNHLLNFAAPAAVLALAVGLMSRVIDRKTAFAMSFQARLAIYFAVGLVVLMGGLWYFGRDGMMATYAVLVTSVATSHWLLQRGWRGWRG